MTPSRQEEHGELPPRANDSFVLQARLSRIIVQADQPVVIPDSDPQLGKTFDQRIHALEVLSQDLSLTWQKCAARVRGVSLANQKQVALVENWSHVKLRADDLEFCNTREAVATLEKGRQNVHTSYERLGRVTDLANRLFRDSVVKHSSPFNTLKAQVEGYNGTQSSNERVPAQMLESQDDMVSRLEAHDPEAKIDDTLKSEPGAKSGDERAVSVDVQTSAVFENTQRLATSVNTESYEAQASETRAATRTYWHSVDQMQNGLLALEQGQASMSTSIRKEAESRVSVRQHLRSFVTALQELDSQLKLPTA